LAINAELISDIYRIIEESKENCKPVRIIFDRFIREKKFNSKNRKEISDFFFNGVRF
jgi:hypothetical protein